MAGFLGLLVSNVATALALAILALVAARLVRRPAIVHGLWLLVLVKLVTPPIIPLHIAQPDWVAGLARAEPPAATVASPGSWTHLLPGVEPPRATWATPEMPAAADAMGLQDRDTGRALRAEEGVTGGGLSSFPLATLLVGMLSLGSTMVLLLTCHRVRTFNRALRRAGTPSRELLSEVRSVGRRLGVRQVPTVLLVPGCISPMLWSGLGRARLILPEDLVADLAVNERRTLIAHELAHFRRGDHIVRLLELAATLLYWWCPLLYLARRRLRQAEEECCDAWVLWAEPGEVRSYAGALLQTIDFMARNGRLLPPVASGISGGRFLKRRVEMIMNARTPRGAGVLGRSLLVLLAALVLPLVPAWAQDPREDGGEGASGETRETPDSNPGGEARELEMRLRRLEQKNEELKREARRREARDVREHQRQDVRRKAEILMREGRMEEAQALLEAIDKKAQAAERARTRAERHVAINVRKQALLNIERAEQRIAELERKIVATRKSGDLYAASRLEAVLAQSMAELERARAEVDAMTAHRRARDQERKMLEQKLRLRERDAAALLAGEERRLTARKRTLEADRRALEEQARRVDPFDPKRNRAKTKGLPKRPMTRQQRIRMLEDHLEQMKVQMEAMTLELRKLFSEQRAERKERRTLKL